MSDEDFESQKSAIRTLLAEKDTSMMKQANRFLSSEISTHRYFFERQNKDLETLETVTKDDFKAYFEEVFFSAETARFDLQLTSKAHKAD